LGPAEGIVGPAVVEVDIAAVVEVDIVEVVDTVAVELVLLPGAGCTACLFHNTIDHTAE
jgi:hypothetical protein